MQKFTNMVQQARKAVQDIDLLKVIQSEIALELSSNRFNFQKDEIGYLGDFVVDWDAPESKDILLRRKCDSGEEIAVSAMLGPVDLQSEGMTPREVVMKVCVKKPGLSSILQFDCGVFGNRDNESDFDIHNAFYLQHPSRLERAVYRGPPFCTLDPDLQNEFKKYLMAKGIQTGLTDFLLLYLHKKEQDQYVRWLQSLERFVADSE